MSGRCLRKLDAGPIARVPPFARLNQAMPAHRLGEEGVIEYDGEEIIED